MHTTTTKSIYDLLGEAAQRQNAKLIEAEQRREARRQAQQAAQQRQAEYLAELLGRAASRS